MDKSATRCEEILRYHPVDTKYFLLALSIISDGQAYGRALLLARFLLLLSVLAAVCTLLCGLTVGFLNGGLKWALYYAFLLTLNLMFALKTLRRYRLLKAYDAFFERLLYVIKQRIGRASSE